MPHSPNTSGRQFPSTKIGSLRARDIAAVLLAKRAERRDALFGHVDRSPTGEHDVFQICAGLVRVTNNVHLAGLRAAG